MLKSLWSIVFFACFIICGMHVNCMAMGVSLQWDSNTEPDLAGYKVYYLANATAPPFNGTGAAEGSSPLDAHNQPSLTITGLDPAYSYSFAVTAYNSTGVESSYSNIVTIPEQLPPSVSLTFPANNSNVSGTVSVTAAASDNIAVSKVEFYLDGVLMGIDSSSTYIYSWNTATAVPGVHTLLARAYDTAGNVGESSVVTVTVVNDNTAPTVSITSPAANASASGIVSINATASDNVGVSRVEFFLNNILQAAVNTIPYSYNLNTATLTNGSYLLSAKAYDAAGNSAQSASISINVNNIVPDTTAPTITAFTMPTNSTSLTVAINSLTATDSVGVTGYMITESSIAPAATAMGWTTLSPTTFTFSASGSRTAYAWSKDAAGNISASMSRIVVISLPDTTAPIVSISNPAPNASVSGIVAVTANSNDNVAVTRVEFYVDGILTATDLSLPYSFNWDTRVIANTSHVLSARAYDSAGNVGQSNYVMVTVNNSSSLPSGTYTAVFGNAAGSDYPNAVQDTFINIDNQVNATATILNTYSWPANTPANAILMSWDISSLPVNAQIQSATLLLYMNQMDGTGGDEQYEIPVSAIINKQPDIANANGYTYDGTNPWTPSTIPYNNIPLAQSDIALPVDSPLIDKVFGYKTWNVTSIVKDWKANPVSNKGMLLNSSSKASSDSNRAFASSRATDSNQRPKLVINYTLSDMTPPKVVINSNPVLSGQVGITASASDDVAVTKVEFYLNGAMKFVTSTVPYVFNWDTTMVANGTHELFAMAYDAAGNIGQSAKVIVNVTNDTAPPTVSIISPSNNATLSGTVAVNATASDDVGIAKVEFYLNGILNNTLFMAPYNFILDTKPLPNGMITLAVKAYDFQGKVTQSNIDVSVNNAISAPIPEYTISDATLALQIAVGKVKPTNEQKVRLDVAPFVSGKSVPNGKIDAADAIVILSKVVGKTVM